MAAGPSTGPRRQDAHQNQKVTATTLERYRKALAPFVQRLDERALVPQQPEEYDDLAVEFNNDSPELSRASFSMLVAALEWFHPELRRRTT